MITPTEYKNKVIDYIDYLGYEKEKYIVSFDFVLEMLTLGYTLGISFRLIALLMTSAIIQMLQYKERI